MEHRWSARIPLSTRVTLYRNRQPVTECFAKDIGRGGLFVATGPLTYSKNTPLDVDITLDTDEGPKQFCLPAYIIRCTETGVGLMFRESNNELSSLIRRLLLNGVDVRDQAPRRATA